MDKLCAGQDQNCQAILQQQMLKRIIEKIKQHRYKILAAVSFVAAGYFFYYSFSDDRSIKMSTFLDALKSEQINEIVVKGDTVYFRSLTSDWYHSVIGNYPLFELFRQIRDTPNVAFSCQPESGSPIMLIPIVVPIAGLYLLWKSMPAQYGKEVYRRENKANTCQSFDSFYGGDKIKGYLKEAIQFMKNPGPYEKFGLRIRRGILLHGPPGTGKTMLARIMANEAGLEFFSASASQFEQIFVGVGPKRIRDIFEKARKVERGAIIFIDEIDAIGSRSQHWQTKEQRSTINQLLTEIDGFTQNNKIFIIGATNNLALVDTALLRSGRFDLKIYVPPPTEEDRAGIIRTLLRSKRIPSSLGEAEVKAIARSSEGWCGADLENLLNESGYVAVRKGQAEVGMGAVREAMEVMGRKDIM